jgi:hypothetical protein
MCIFSHRITIKEIEKLCGLEYIATHKERSRKMSGSSGDNPERLKLILLANGTDLNDKKQAISSGFDFISNIITRQSRIDISAAVGLVEAFSRQMSFDLEITTDPSRVANLPFFAVHYCDVGARIWIVFKAYEEDERFIVLVKRIHRSRYKRPK